MPHRSLRPCTVAVTLVAIATAPGCARELPDPATDPGAAATSSSSSRIPSPSQTTPPPQTTPSPRPKRPPTTPVPLVAAADWAESDFGPSLEIAPTAAGREAGRPQDAALAWQEVLRLAPDAGTPGMWEQFACHWTWARILEPGKPTWNIEPWRPVVSADRMLAEGCNPGGPEV